MKTITYKDGKTNPVIHGNILVKVLTNPVVYDTHPHLQKNYKYEHVAGYAPYMSRVHHLLEIYHKPQEQLAELAVIRNPVTGMVFMVRLDDIRLIS